MAICTDCGDVYNDHDMGYHVCDPSEIPSKGKKKRFGTNTIIDNPHKRV